MKMQHIFKTFALIAATIGMTACAQPKTNNEMAKNENKKVLVAFFSRTGENYSVGNIAKGNTHIIAEMIAKETGGELFEIAPTTPYPTNYDRCTEVAKEEKDAKARPAIKADKDIEAYDIIFVGYPNWWSDMPMPVYTWIEKHNWAGKTVIPFCTHEGSGLGSTPSKLAAACKGAEMLDGFECYGHVAQKQQEQARKSVKQWIDGLGLSF